VRRTDASATRPALIGAAIAACAFAPAASAEAQVAGSLSLVSDYRVRGVSISDFRPAASLSISDDFANGVYLGGSAVGEDSGDDGLKSLGQIVYLGYARRLPDGSSWEVGASNQRYTVYTSAPFRVNYAEVYAGYSTSRFSTRLSYTPNYNGSDHNVLYAEAATAVRPADDWRIEAHVGVFQPLNKWPRSPTLRAHTDARFAVARKLGPTEVSLGWTGVTPPFNPAPKRSRGGLVVGLSAFF
jgi:uncharacterized protein (TIGR02001 family)